MRVFLRKIKTGWYYSSDERWVKDPAKAYSFQSIREAARMARQQPLLDVEIVVAYFPPLSEITLPILPEPNVPLKHDQPEA